MSREYWQQLSLWLLGVGSHPDTIVRLVGWL